MRPRQATPGAVVAADPHPTPDGTVSVALVKLVESGEIFTTIDDEHFQCVWSALAGAAGSSAGA